MGDGTYISLTPFHMGEPGWMVGQTNNKNNINNAYALLSCACIASGRPVSGRHLNRKLFNTLSSISRQDCDCVSVKRQLLVI